MTFNWFNRFNKNDDADEKPDTAPVQPEPDSTPDPAPAAEDAQAAALARAKAAMEAIKKRQQQSQQSTPTEVDPARAEPAAEVVVEPEAPEPQIAEEPPAPQAEEAEISEPVAAIAAQPSETIEPQSSTNAPLPFWAQAEADRQARLERLRATAIETETEPEPTPEAPTVDDEILTIDEGFMWSVDVLSSMGRQAEDVTAEEITWLKRLRKGLDKTRRSLVNRLKAIVGQGPLNQDAVYEIESLLLQADAGVEATDKVIEALQNKLREETLPPDQAIAYLKQILRDLLDQPLQGSHSAFFAPEKDTLNIWLMTGVNGAGKTTTIGKLAHIAKKSGYNCLIAAADTFRAAAVEQVKVWGQRSNVEVIANPGQNTDPAAVVFDAISAAQARGTELLLVDTAGRLQNKKNLMDELSKVRRIIDKKAGNAKVESLLVLDATLGQNGLKQAEVFSQAAQLSGVVLTKLDGTAKGGIALAIVEQLGLPIRFIGAGEGIEDLRPFSSYEFVEALISG